MNVRILVEVWHGDGGGMVTSVMVISDEKITASYVPPLNKAKLCLDRRVTESWAFVLVNDENDRDEMWDGEDFIYDLDKFIVIHFGSDYSYSENAVASYKDIKKALVKTIKNNKYSEKTDYDGSKKESEFMYPIPKTVFKKEDK